VLFVLWCSRRRDGMGTEGDKNSRRRDGMGTEGDKNSEKAGKQSIGLLFSRLLWSEAEGVSVKLLFTVYVRLMQPPSFCFIYIYI
jgi:hypothetical protein